MTYVQNPDDFHDFFFFTSNSLFSKINEQAFNNPLLYR